MNLKINFTIAILLFYVLLAGCNNGNHAPVLADSHSTNSASRSHEGSQAETQPSGNGGIPTEAGLHSFESWLGHWENENGQFWIVISYDRDFEIEVAVAYGRKVTRVTHSEDYRHLTFVLDDRWTYELILNVKNNAQVDYSDHDNRDGPDVWGSGKLYKLSRNPVR